MNNELVKDRISKFLVMCGCVMEIITDYQKVNGAFIIGDDQSNCLDDWLTVHRSITLVDFQLDA